MKTQRLVIGSAGIALALFGCYRLFTQTPTHALIVLGLWLIGALVIHDGILSPLVVAVGWVIARTVPPRARRYLQGALIAGGLVTVIAIPMIRQSGKEPASKAILRQNFAGNLTVLLAIIAAVSLFLYALHVARDGRNVRAVGPGRRTTDVATDPVP